MNPQRSLRPAAATKLETALLVVALAAALGACGDRAEEKGAAVSEPAAPRVDAPPAAAQAPAVAPPPPAVPTPSTPAADAANAAATPAAPDAPVASATAPAPVTSAPASPATAPAAVEARSAPAATSSTPGTMLRADKLYSAPTSTSQVTANVAKGESVAILGKQAGWLRVQAGSQSGWVRLLSVRAGSGGLGGVGVGDVVGAATTRSDPTRVVAVAGLRGLNDEDLKQAQFNAEELARMDARNVSATQARTFASESGLVAVSVPDLPKPQAK